MEVEVGHIVSEGGCLCGGVRYRISGQILGTGACHCRDCQYICGGAPSYVLVVSKSSLEILKGETVKYESKADSGATRVRHFCPRCGTPLFAENRAFPSVVTIKAGSLDDPSVFQLATQFWVQSAPHWHYIDPEIPSFAKGPDSNLMKSSS